MIVRRFHNPSTSLWLLLAFAWLATRDAVPLAYAANDLNQYSQVGGLPQSHNSRGDLASHRGWALAYDAVGHLVQATGPGSSPTVIHYLHDGGGRRVGRSQSDAGGWDTTWFLQLGVQVMEARNPATGATAHFIHEPGLDQPLCRIDASAGVGGSVVHYFHQDALGSVVALTNPAGAVVESYRYTAWGRPNVYDSNGILQAAGTPAQSAYLFTGREYEVATGLAHHRARWYSRELGRWTGPDPIGEAGGVNLYGYVFNSPVTYWDPFGESPLVAIPLAIAEAAGTIADILTGIDMIKNGATEEEVTGYCAGVGAGLLTPGSWGWLGKWLKKAPKKPLLPDEAWSKNAPHQVTPGTRQLEHTKYNKKTKQPETSTVEYDDYGRQVKRTDNTDHGYGDPSKPDYHSTPHDHTYDYGPGYGPKGKETRTNR